MKKKLKYSEYLKQVSDNIIFKTSDTHFLTDNSAKNIIAYQNNYTYGLIGSLKLTYPCTFISLGEENFSYFAYQYIKKTSSKNSNIDLYGEHFSNFLHESKELESRKLISYLAKIDWFLYLENTRIIIKLPQGCLKLWENIIMEEDKADIFINEDIQSIIELYLDDYGEYLMRQKQ